VLTPYTAVWPANFLAVDNDLAEFKNKI